MARQNADPMRSASGGCRVRSQLEEAAHLLSMMVDPRIPATAPTACSRRTIPAIRTRPCRMTRRPGLSTSRAKRRTPPRSVRGQAGIGTSTPPTADRLRQLTYRRAMLRKPRFGSVSAVARKTAATSGRRDTTLLRASMAAARKSGLVLVCRNSTARGTQRASPGRHSFCLHRSQASAWRARADTSGASSSSARTRDDTDSSSTRRSRRLTQSRLTMAF